MQCKNYPRVPYICIILKTKSKRYNNKQTSIDWTVCIHTTLYTGSTEEQKKNRKKSYTIPSVARALLVLAVRAAAAEYCRVAGLESWCVYVLCMVWFNVCALFLCFWLGFAAESDWELVVVITVCALIFRRCLRLCSATVALSRCGCWAREVASHCLGQVSSPLPAISRFFSSHTLATKSERKKKNSLPCAREERLN